MKLIYLQVCNYRSIQDSGEFYVKPFFTFVGENNSGKSNLLHAIEILLSAGAGGVTQTDFKDPSLQIIIKGLSEICHLTKRMDGNLISLVMYSP